MGYVGQDGASSPMSVVSPARSASQAIPILYGSHYPHLVRLAVLLLGDPGRAEKIVQDAFVGLVQRWPRLRDQRAAVSYLRTSVANGACSALRHVVVVRRHPADPPSDQAGDESGAMAHVERERIMTALYMLPERQRQVLILRYYGQLSDAEIADTLGVSRRTVNSHSARGLASLRPVLEVAG
jgi:RNA polymerase sigma-70 factor (sigma-E family)